MEFSDNIFFKKDFIGMECKRCLKREEGDRIISEPFPLILSTNQLSRLAGLSFKELRNIGFSEDEISQIYKLNKDINDQH